MSLDLLVESDDVDRFGVSIDVYTHWIIVSEAEAEKLEMFKKIKNYYEDTVYDMNETKIMIDECGILILKLPPGAIRSSIERVREVFSRAIEQNRRVIAIAD